MIENLINYDSDELRNLAAAAEAELDRRLSEERLQALAEIRVILDSVGLTLPELLEAEQKRPVHRGAPKYRNPDDPAQTWTGKGKQPRWYLAALERGLTPDDLLINF